MKCTNCGYELETGVAFCTNCGTKVVPAVDPAVVSSPVSEGNVTPSASSALAETPNIPQGGYVPSMPQTQPSQEADPKPAKEKKIKLPKLKKEAREAAPKDDASKEKGKKKLIMMLILIAAGILVAAIAVIVISGALRNSPKAAAKRYVNAMYAEGDLDKMDKESIGHLSGIVCEDFPEAIDWANFKMLIGTNYNNYKQSTGMTFKLFVLNVDDCSLSEAMRATECPGIALDIAQLKAVKRVDLAMTYVINVNGVPENSSQAFSVYVVNVGGKWQAVPNFEDVFQMVNTLKDFTN